MAGSSDTNNVPEGTTLVFGSWARMADRSGGLSTHLITPKAPESKTINQPAEICKTAELDRKQARLELDPDTAENVLTPTRIHELAESNTKSNSENL